MIRVITFDLDDTLWAVRPVLARAEARVEDWLRTRCPGLLRGEGLPSLQAHRAELLKAHPELTHQITRMRHQLLRRLIEQAGIHDTQQADRLADEAMSVFLSARHEVALFDGVEDAIAELHQHYVLGVLTNGNADIYRLPLGRYFSFAYSAETLDSSKPMPRHFDSALQLTGARPDETVHVGDHAEHDIEGARARGWHTVWVNRHGTPWPGTTPPSGTVTRISDIPAAIRTIEAKLHRPMVASPASPARAKTLSDSG